MKQRGVGEPGGSIAWRRWSARGLGLIAVGTIVSLTVACAQLPADASWTPPAWPEQAQIITVAQAAVPTGEEPGSGTPTVASGDSESGTDGLTDGRIRNDRAGLQLRYVELPGGGEFNDRVRGIIDAAIADTGVTSFTPEAFDVKTGLSERGCAAGVLTMPAAELLVDPKFGPVDGHGTAVVCELGVTLGPILGVSFRTVTGTVTGSDDAITGDRAETLYVNLETGTVTDGTALWNEEAATALWTGTMAGLRRDAGGLSMAPVPLPDEAQLTLAKAALAAPSFSSESASFTLPAGITSQGLTELGAAATTEPMTVTVANYAGWLTHAGTDLLAQRDVPFVGVPAWNAGQPVDCTLVTCVAVTYDDGPGPFTAELLDIFAAQEAATTLFMLGDAVKANPELVARAASEGHELASHTMNHPDLTMITASKARKQVRDAAAAITAITGDPVTMYRPPYGALDQAVLKAVKLPAILWSIDTNDWQDPGHDALITRSVQAATPGDIILFHDVHAATVNAAADVLRGLEDRGFTPVTVTTLFGGNVPSGRVSSQ